MREVTIYRDEWLHGEGTAASCLLRNKDGKKCCLGFYALACGIPIEHINGVSTLATLSEKYTLPEEMLWAVHSKKCNTPKASALMAANDSTYVPSNTTEEYIANKFLEVGVKVVFVDTRPTSTAASQTSIGL